MHNTRTLVLAPEQTLTYRVSDKSINTERSNCAIEYCIVTCMTLHLPEVPAQSDRIPMHARHLCVTGQSLLIQIIY